MIRNQQIRMKTTTRFLISILAFLSVSCNQKPQKVIKLDSLPEIFPDYLNVTIPNNIAPLNFLVKSEFEAMEVKLIGKNDSLFYYSKNQEVRFSINKWKKLLQEEVSLSVNVTLLINGQWYAYDPFYWMIMKEPIDPFLSYRLIEPGYEVWNSVQLKERNVENFDERVLADNNLVENSCMNCHVYGNQSGDLSFFHLRGQNGGTVLNRNGKLSKLKLRTGDMISPAVYGSFHPSGRFGVFSTNIIIPAFHTLGSNRLEVYDTESDIIIVDFENNQIIQPPVLNDSLSFETFPCFSADGQSVFFCSAPQMHLPDSISQLQYNLCAVSFDPLTGQTGSIVDTLYNVRLSGGSVCHLKASPDGHYVLFTLANNGTFPIWHQETDLRLLNLKTGYLDTLQNVNAKNSDTYHSWSSNSRWFVFASKRDDGLYGKPYFCYIDSTGKAHKPFVLPQKNPSNYNFTLKSFNIPELSKTPARFDAIDIEKLYWDTDAISFDN